MGSSFVKLMEYTQDTFLKLLQRNFGEVLFDGGRYYLEGIDHSEIAERLDYDTSSFSACMKAGNKVSFKTIIKRLETYEEVTKLRERLTTAEAENVSFRQKVASLQSQRLAVFVLAGVALLVTLVAMWWLPSRLENSITETGDSTAYIIEDKGRMDIVMEWHGQIMANTLAWEGVVLHERIWKGRTAPLEPAEQMAVLDEIKGILRRTMKRGRNRLHSIEFTTKDGRNLVESLESVVPFATLVDGEEPHYARGFASTMPLFLNPKTSAAELAEVIREESYNFQVEAWTAMRQDLFPE